jgi:hypothetical protein
MTEIPEHLRKRAELARRLAENPDAILPPPPVTRHWESEMSIRVARAIVAMAEQIPESNLKYLTAEQNGCVWVARSVVKGEDNKRREAAMRLIKDYEAEWGEITAEELAEIKKELSD